MALLGLPVLVTVLVVALVMPPALLLAWPRVRGPRPARIAQRVALVLTAQLAALLVGLVALNDYGQFFTSWSELFGTGPKAHVVTQEHFGADRTIRLSPAHPIRPPSVRHIGLGNSDKLPPGTTATSWSKRSQWPTRGAVVSMPVTGDTTGLSEKDLVYLPPAYFEGTRALPMVEVFTGYPGSTLALVDRLHYPSSLLAEMEKGVQQMVLVMLRPSVTYPRDTECTDVPHGPQAFSYFAQDVPTAVAAEFGLQPTSYGAIGDSTGALCATKLAVMDPSRFVAAVSLSGYFYALHDFTTGDLYGSTAVRERNDILWRLQHLPLPAVSLLLTTSLTEKGSHRAAQKLLSLVHAPMAADEMVLNQGGHNYETWNAEIPLAMRWLGEHLPA